MFRKPDCIIIRIDYGSNYRSVRNRAREKLEESNVKFSIETNPNRVFVFTEEIERALEILKETAGISSISPAWSCFSGLNEIKLLVVDIAEKVLGLGEKNSFALRTRRAGRHKFNSKIIAEEVGGAIKRVTGASVNLKSPDKEIFIECRSRKTYIFTEKFTRGSG